MLGSIIKRGNRYTVAVYVGIDPATKKKRYKWHGGFATRREAEAFQVTLAHHPAFSAGLGMYGNSRLRTGDYLDQWLKNHSSVKALEEKTATWYGQAIRIHLKPTLGHLPLSRLSPQTIQDLYDRLLHKPVGGCRKSRGKRTLSRTTVRHVANLLHLAMSDAVKHGLVARNPVDQTEPPSRDTKPTVVLTPTQLHVLLKDARASAPTPIWVLYLTKAGTGMRFGELLGLREIDLDLERGRLSVVQTLKHPGPRVVFGKPKTDRSRRTITLPGEVIEALRQLRRWRVEQKLRLGPKFQEHGLVFCTQSGRPMHQNNIRHKDFYPRLERLGLPRIRPHDLRHTHGTLLIGAGVDPRTVADRLGHSSPAFTMSVYVHGTSEAQERAALAANQLLIHLGSSVKSPSRGNP